MECLRLFGGKKTAGVSTMVATRMVMQGGCHRIFTGDLPSAKRIMTCGIRLFSNRGGEVENQQQDATNEDKKC